MLPAVFSWISNLGRDGREAIRGFRRRPGLTAATVLALALGIGTATGVYAVFSPVLFQPVAGVRDPDQLVSLVFYSPEKTASGSVDRSALATLRTAGRPLGLVDVANFCCGSSLVLSAADLPAAFVKSDFVTEDFFRTLGVAALNGRLPSPSDLADATAHFAVISDALWQRTFGGTPDVIGRAVLINQQPFVIIGVVRDFRGWGHRTRIGDTDLWLPMSSERVVTGGTSNMHAAIGRVRPGTNLRLLQERLQQAYLDGGSTGAYSTAFVPFVDRGLVEDAAQGSARDLFWLVMAAAILLLLLGSANAAHLMLMRAHQRRFETAIRLAIGSGPWAIVRSALVEAFGIAALSAVLALLLASAIVLVFANRLRLFQEAPGLTAHVGADAIVFCVIAAAAATLAAVVAPALIASRTTAGLMVTHGNGRTTAPSRGLSQGLMTAQIALSLVLVGGAAELTGSLRNLLTTNLGLDYASVVELTLDPARSGHTRAEGSALVDTVTDALRQAGIGEVARGDSPFGGGSEVVQVTTDTDSTARRMNVLVHYIGDRYFDVFRIPLVAGHLFEPGQDTAPRTTTPLVINGALAAELFGAQAAVGRRLGLGQYTNHSGGFSLAVTDVTVVGVVGDTLPSAVRGSATPALYRLTPPGPGDTIFVRAGHDLAGSIMRIRQIVDASAPGVPIATLQPLANEVNDRLGQDRLVATLSGAMAWFSIVLGFLGVASTIGQVVYDRTRDFGIRLALGASKRDIAFLLAKWLGGRCGIGLVVGLGLYYIGSAWLTARLFGLSPLDPMYVSSSVLAIVVVAVLAAFAPVLRAVRIDPASTLRVE
jgi:predicted permease